VVVAEAREEATVVPAYIGTTALGIGFETQPRTVAVVARLQGRSFAALSSADSFFTVQFAVSSAVTEAVESTGGGFGSVAVALRVCWRDNELAIPCAVAQLAGWALVSRVSVVAKEAAQPLDVDDVASLAEAVTGGVAAHPVNAVTTGALVVAIAQVGEVLFGHARRRIAEVGPHAVGVDNALSEASNSGIVADVGRAHGGAQVKAIANAVAQVGGMLQTILAELRCTDGIFQPQSTYSCTVAGSVEVARSHRVSRTITNRVSPLEHKVTGVTTRTGLAQRAIIFRVGLGVEDSTRPLEAGNRAGLAGHVAEGIAAEPVNTVGRQALVGADAGLAVVLLGHTGLTAAPVQRHAVVIRDTSREAVDQVLCTQIGFALGDPLVHAAARSIAKVRVMQGRIVAFLVQADSTIHPQAASACAITSAILVARTLTVGSTLGQRVFSYRHRHTTWVARTVLAKAALEFYVRCHIIVGALTFQVYKSAVLARAIAGRVAAVAVSAVVRETLVSASALITVGFLRHASLPLAIVEQHAIVVGFAGEQALRPTPVAHIRIARDLSGINAHPGAIAIVIRILDVTYAVLGKADGSVAPQAAFVAAIAEAILAANLHVLGNAVIERVGTVLCCLAGTGAIAQPAVVAFKIRVGVVEGKCTDTHHTFLVTFLTCTITGRVAANAVHTEVGLALVARTAKLTIVVLLFALLIGIAPIIRYTMVIHFAERSAGKAGTITHIRPAEIVAAVIAGTRTVASVLPVDHVAWAVLVEAHGTVHPQAASSGTVATTVLLAVCLGLFFTVVDGVVPRGDDDTAIGVPGTGVAQWAIVFRVGIVFVQGAGTFGAYFVAGLADVVTDRVAAEAVDADVGQALSALAAGLAVFFLRHALVAEAIVDVLAIGIGIARLEAIDAVPTADVGHTIHWRSIDTFAHTVTEVCRVLQEAHARLLFTDGCGIPQTARSDTVAPAILVTGGHIVHGAIVLRVLAINCGHAAADAITHLAKRALEFRIGVLGIVGARTELALDIAGLARVIAQVVTAVAVNAHVGQALVVAAAHLAVLLLRHALIHRVAPVQFDAVHIFEAVVTAVRTEVVAHERVARRRTAVDTVPHPIAQVVRMQRVVHAGLRLAHGFVVPQAASSSAVADAVQVTRGLCILSTFALRVGSVRGVLARPATVTHPAQTALGLGIGVVVIVGALTNQAGYRTTAASIAALGVAAHAVHAEAGLALGVLEALVPIVVLLNALVGHVKEIVAPVGGDTVGIVHTVFLTIDRVVVAHIRVARVGSTVIATADTVAGVVQVLGVLDAELVLANRSVFPQLAGPNAIAQAVELAGMFTVDQAVVCRVSIHNHYHAGIIHTGTGIANSAVVFRVGLRWLRSTGTESSLETAGLAQSVADVVAAIAVHANVRQALVGAVAGFAIILLRLADLVRVAPMDRIAVVVGFAERATSRRSVVAHVGWTGLQTVVDTFADAVAGVCRVQLVHQAFLGLAHGQRQPQSAFANTVAGAVQVASTLVVGSTLAEGVNPRFHRGTPANTVANVANVAFVFRVGIEEVVPTESDMPGQLADVSEPTGSVALGIVPPVAEVGLQGDTIFFVEVIGFTVGPRLIVQRCAIGPDIVAFLGCVGETEPEAQTTGEVGDKLVFCCAVHAGQLSTVFQARRVGSGPIHRSVTNQVTGLVEVDPARRATAGTAGTLAIGITAIAIDALVRLALVAGCRSGARVTVVLLQDALGTVAPTVRRTLGVTDAVGIATPVTVANVRVAGAEFVIEALAQSVASVRVDLVVLHPGALQDTGLVGASRTLKPVPASAVAAASAVKLALNLRAVTAVIHGVFARDDVDALSGTVAHPTFGAIVFRVTGRSMEGTHTFLTQVVTGLAVTATVGVTAVAVVTEAGDALVRAISQAAEAVYSITGLGYRFLRHADAAQVAPVARCAVRILIALGETVGGLNSASAERELKRGDNGSGAGVVRLQRCGHVQPTGRKATFLAPQSLVQCLNSLFGHTEFADGRQVLCRIPDTASEILPVGLVVKRDKVLHQSLLRSCLLNCHGSQWCPAGGVKLSA
jgi:hypothetical protein